MDKDKQIALLFSGQGAQRAGMGKSLYENSMAAKVVFDKAEALRPGTIAQCFEGSAEILSRTINTQPCLYCVDLAAAASVAEVGIVPKAVAGFSLGELAALAFAGAFSVEDGFQIVRKRAEFMDEASEKSASAMVAVLKLNAAQTETVCGEFTECYPVNYNCPGQTVVALRKTDLTEFCEFVSRAGGRAMTLPVSGGFHSPFMDSVRDRLHETLAESVFLAPTIPVYSNQTAKPYGEDIGKQLAEQVNHPVLFQTTVENMIADGITVFIEVGIGKTLSGFVKKTAQELHVDGIEIYNIEDVEGLKAIR